MNLSLQPLNAEFKAALEIIRKHPESAQEIATWSPQVGGTIRLLVALTHDAESVASDTKAASFVRDDNLDGPNRHHRMRDHAYIHGSLEKYDRTVEDTVIIYGRRISMGVQVFEEPFSPAFFEYVIQGVATHIQYRDSGTLPPADTVYGWECSFRSFKNRCGQSDRFFSDVGSIGLLPLVKGCSHECIVEHLDSHDGARLTPTLARQYPDLTEEYSAHDWECRRCAATYSFRESDKEENLACNEEATDAPPRPDCASENVPIPLRGPTSEKHALSPSDD